MLIKGPKKMDERPILYYSLHLEMVADHLEAKIVPRPQLISGDEVIKLQSYLEFECSLPSRDLVQEMVLLFKAAQSFVAVRAKKLEDKTFTILLNILDATGKTTLKRAEKATKGVFKEWMVQQFNSDQRGIQLLLARCFLRSFFDREDISNDALLRLTLYNLEKDEILENVLSSDDLKKIHEAYQAIPRPAIPKLGEIHHLFRLLAMCKLETWLPLNVARFGEASLRFHLLSEMKTENKSFSLLLEKAKKTLEKLKEKYSESFSIDEPLFSYLADFFFNTSNSTLNDTATAVSDEKHPLFPLLALCVFKQAKQGKAYNEKVLQDLLLAYFEIDWEKDLQQMVGALSCEELLYDRIKAEEKSKEKPLTKKYQETARRGSIETFKKAMELYKEIRSLQKSTSNPFGSTELDAKKTQLLNLNTDSYPFLKLCLNEFKLLQ